MFKLQRTRLIWSRTAIFGLVIILVCLGKTSVWAAGEAKIKLQANPYSVTKGEFAVTVDSVPANNLRSIDLLWHFKAKDQRHQDMELKSDQIKIWYEAVDSNWQVSERTVDAAMEIKGRQIPFGPKLSVTASNTKAAIKPGVIGQVRYQLSDQNISDIIMETVSGRLIDAMGKTVLAVSPVAPVVSVRPAFKVDLKVNNSDQLTGAIPYNSRVRLSWQTTSDFPCQASGSQLPLVNDQIWGEQYSTITKNSGSIEAFARDARYGYASDLELTLLCLHPEYGASSDTIKITLKTGSTPPVIIKDQARNLVPPPPNITAAESAKFKRLEVKLPRALDKNEQAVMDYEFSLVKRVDLEVVKKVAGRILLQVQSVGEAWYVDPLSRNKFYLQNGQAAFDLMRSFGLGISTANLEQIPLGWKGEIYQLPDADQDGLSDKAEIAVGSNPRRRDSDEDGYDDLKELISGFSPVRPNSKYQINAGLIKQMTGRIVLQVDRNGEAWYINPADGRRYFLADPETAYQVMRWLGMGISNNDLRQVMVGKYTR